MFIIQLKFSTNKANASQFMDGHNAWLKDGFAKGTFLLAGFKGFDYNKIARFTEKDVARLLQDEGIVRHRGKIEAVINNAQRAAELVKEEESLAAYIWQFEPKPGHIATQTASTSVESVAFSKALKKQGWKFVGPTTVYAFMQAMGLINDHVEAV